MRPFPFLSRSRPQREDADPRHALPAAASLDDESDKLVQRVIREEFEGCTNLTVAHRLGPSLFLAHLLRSLPHFLARPTTDTRALLLSPAETVIDFDRILVLRAGRVVEFDSPLALLDKPEGVFREMVEATGNLDALRRAAGGRDAGEGSSGGREQ